MTGPPPLMAKKFQVGETVGDYRIIKVLGSGGAGRVFQVQHNVTQRIEAMKILLEHASEEAELGERFLREVRVQASLSHPNIAAAYNAFYSDSALVMVMEWAPGKPLRTLVEEGRVRFDAGVNYVCQVLEALDYAHAQGVVHRDVTPANVIVSEGGQVKLTDFGLAKTRRDPRVTQAGMAMGSLYYMAPEQIRGLPNTDHRVDIYAAGAVLYEVLTGHRPFEAEDSFALMRAHVEEQPRPPAELSTAVSAELSAVVQRALAKSPEDRFKTAREFREALQHAIGSHCGGAFRWTPRIRKSMLKSPSVRFWLASASIGLLALLTVMTQTPWLIFEPRAPMSHLRHAPPLPEFALHPPYLPSEAAEPGEKHSIRRLLRRVNPFRQGHARSASNKQ